MEIGNCGFYRNEEFMKMFVGDLDNESEVNVI